MADERQIGLIGVGTMGRGLARNLLKAGFPLQIVDPNPKAVEEAVGMGAKDAGSIAALAGACDVAITCLPSIASIRDSYLGADCLIARAAEGKVLIDCSTSDPALTREIAMRAKDAGLSMLDAPMFRSPPNAWDGTLHLVVGGEEKVIEDVRAVFEAISEKIIHAGPIGTGHVIKLINNAVTITNCVMLCEIFTVARKFEVDLQRLVEVMDATQAGSKQLTVQSPRLIADEHSPSFSVDVAKKDISLYCELANGAGAITSLGNVSRDLLRLASAQGYGAEHYTRIVSILEAVAVNP